MVSIVHSIQWTFVKFVTFSFIVTRRSEILSSDVTQKNPFKSERWHLSTAVISAPDEELLPNLKVISSGCFFLEVIFTTEFRACLDWM